MTAGRTDEDGKAQATGRAAALTGWIVFRPRPWHFVGVFACREQAETERARGGQEYQVAYGTADVESGRYDGHEQE